MFYTDDLESQQYSRLDMFRSYGNTVYCHDSVHIFLCSTFQKFLYHNLLKFFISVELHIYVYSSSINALRVLL